VASPIAPTQPTQVPATTHPARRSVMRDKRAQPPPTAATRVPDGPRDLDAQVVFGHQPLHRHRPIQSRPEAQRSRSRNARVGAPRGLEQTRSRVPLRGIRSSTRFARAGRWPQAHAEARARCAAPRSVAWEAALRASPLLHRGRSDAGADRRARRRPDPIRSGRLARRLCGGRLARFVAADSRSGRSGPQRALQTHGPRHSYPIELGQPPVGRWRQSAQSGAQPRGRNEMPFTRPVPSAHRLDGLYRVMRKASPRWRRPTGAFPGRCQSWTVFTHTNTCWPASAEDAARWARGTEATPLGAAASATIRITTAGLARSRPTTPMVLTVVRAPGLVHRRGRRRRRARFTCPRGRRRQSGRPRAIGTEESRHWRGRPRPARAPLSY
jgi:hypothetical protein